MEIKNSFMKIICEITENTSINNHIILLETNKMEIIDSFSELSNVIRVWDSNEEKWWSEKINIIPNSVIVPYKDILDVSYIIYCIDDEYRVTLYNISLVNQICKVYNNYNLSLASIILYEKIKRERGK